MTKKIQATIVNTRSILDCILSYKLSPTDTEIQNIKDGFEAVVKELEKRSPDDDTQLGKQAKVALDHHFQNYVNRNNGSKPTINGGADMKRLIALLRNYELSTVLRVNDFFFNWPRYDYSIATFCRKFDVYYLKLKEQIENGKTKITGRIQRRTM